MIGELASWLWWLLVEAACLALLPCRVPVELVVWYLGVRSNHAEQYPRQRAVVAQQTADNNHSDDSDDEQEILVWLRDVRPEQVAAFGGKGAKLGGCTAFLRSDDAAALQSQHDFAVQVPDGFCISSRGVRQLLHGDRESVELAVRAALATLGGGPVAVRSSAACEDGAAASFAGQFATLLNLRSAERVLSAVYECAASSASSRAASYTSAHASSRAGGFAVVVQRMAAATCAGVAFSANPAPNSAAPHDEVVVTANWGLGESVVADLSRVDTFVLRTGADLTLVEQHVAAKDKMVVADGEGTSLCSVPPERVQQPCIDASNVLRIAALAKALERFFGQPQDVEWALDARGVVYLLQSRPITRLAAVVADDSNHDSDDNDDDDDDDRAINDDWLTTCNTTEMLPGAATPLTVDVFGFCIEWGMQCLQMDFGVRARFDPTRAILHWHRQHFLLNMTNLGLLCCGLPLAQQTKNNAEISILGRVNSAATVDELRRRHGLPCWAKRLTNGVRYALTMLTAERRVPRMRQRIAHAAEQLRAVQRPGVSARQTYCAVDGLLHALADQWADGIACGSTSAGFMVLVMRLLCAADPSQMWSAAKMSEVAQLLGRSSGYRGSGDVESLDVVQSLDRLARDIAAGQQEREPFHQLTAAAALQWIQSPASGLAARFDAFLQRHGHRCIREAEFRALDWATEPLSLVPVLQKLVKAVLQHGGQQQHSEQQQRRHAGLLGWALRMTMQGVQRRELAKSLQVQMHSIVKRMYRLLAVRLHAEAVLPDADLLYFLRHAELAQLCSAAGADAPVVAQLGRLAARRRRRLARLAAVRFCGDLFRGRPVVVTRTAAAAAGHAQRGVATELRGMPVSAGVAVARVRIVESLADADSLLDGEIMVCPSTDVGWTPYFSLAAGLVTEIGGLLSHGAVVAREYGLPCVVNVAQACSKLTTGQMVHLDGARGVIRTIDE